MGKLLLYVCENFATEYAQVVSEGQYPEVTVQSFPCLCDVQGQANNVVSMIHASRASDVIVIAGNHCGARFSDAEELQGYRIRTAGFCLHHLINEAIYHYLIEQGGYIIGSGWLKNWRERFDNMGFDQETARLFFQEFCRELLFFDTGTVMDARERMGELASYLQLPYRIFRANLDGVDNLIRSMVFEWRLHEESAAYRESLAQVQSQSAEYLAIVELMEEISAYTKKEDVLQKIGELFALLFGAQSFRYWGVQEELLPEPIVNFLNSPEQISEYNPQDNRLYVRVGQERELFGVLEAGDFLFPAGVPKYLHVAVSIARVSALVFSSVNRYEKLLASEQELMYKSYHDALTGVYNRQYMNKLMREHTGQLPAVFICDLDKLKHVNDTFGHAEGDKLIVRAAGALKECLRDEDLVARIGGDEFAIVVDRCDEKMAQRLKKRIYSTVRNRNRCIKDKRLSLAISVGYAVARDRDDATLESLMREADHQMYKDKSLKNRKPYLGNNKGSR